MGNVIKKFVFLDIDGVLNCESFIHKLHKEKLHHMSDYATIRDVTETFMPSAIESLNSLIEQTGAEIVVSSSWRKLYTLKQLRGILKKNGFKYSEIIIDKTPSFEVQWNVEYCRGEEIYKWLKDKDYLNHSFVILDDDSDMGRLLGNLVKTNWKGNGLEKEHIEQAVKLLSEKKMAKTSLTCFKKNGRIQHNYAIRLVDFEYPSFIPHYCGYIEIEKSSPFFGINYNEIHEMFEALDVHGGLTYSEDYIDLEKKEEFSDRWFIGFDCNHYQDMINPKSESYVFEEIKRLSEQICEYETNWEIKIQNEKNLQDLEERIKNGT